MVRKKGGCYFATFADGALLPHDSIGVHVCDVNGKVPAAAGHAAGDRHTQGVVRLLGQSDCLLVAGWLLTGVLGRANTERKNNGIIRIEMRTRPFLCGYV